jgi:hypothetical protein
MPIEKSSDLTGNRTRDLPAFSIVPQPTKLTKQKVKLQNLYFNLYVLYRRKMGKYSDVTGNIIH